MVQELHRVVERILYDGSRKTSLGHSRTSEPPPGDGVLTVHTLIDAKGELQDDENYVDVFSPYLQTFLTDILKDYPNAIEWTDLFIGDTSLIVFLPRLLPLPTFYCCRFILNDRDHKHVVVRCCISA